MNYYKEIKEELISNELNKRIKDYSKNKYELQKYYNVGKLLSKAGKNYGEGIIKEYSIKLTNELNKKYDISTLNKMRKFYNLVKKMATVSPNLTYSHYIELLPFKDLNKVFYYIKIIEEQNLSVRQLRARIKSKEYERLPIETRKKQSENEKVTDFVKNPIVIKRNSRYEKFSEKILQKLILEDIPSFLEELGEEFYVYIKSRHL